MDRYMSQQGSLNKAIITLMVGSLIFLGAGIYAIRNSVIFNVPYWGKNLIGQSAIAGGSSYIAFGIFLAIVALYFYIRK